MAYKTSEEKRAYQRDYYSRNKASILAKKAIYRQREDVKKKQEQYMLNHYAKKLAQLNK